MNFNAIKATAKSFGDILRNNSTTILTGMAVVGTISSVVMAVKATPKAMLLMMKDKEERRDKLVDPDDLKTTPIDYIRVCWKVYLPSTLMMFLSVGCTISAQTINLKRNAAMAALYSTVAAKFQEYKDKTVEVIGENKEQKIHDEIAKDYVEAHPFNDCIMIKTGYGEYPCIDTMSGQPFASSIEHVRKVVNDCRETVLKCGYITLNEFYYSLGLRAVKFGDEMGWNSEHPMDVIFSTQQTENGDPCLVIDYTVGPRYDFEPF